MTFTDSQRSALADLMAQLGPDAPTLCGDWTTHDLAAHLWVRENDPLALPGIGIGAFAGLTEARMDRAKQRFAYAELVRRIKNPPFWTKPLSGINVVEFFAHHIDVLRANTGLTEPTLSSQDQDTLWRTTRLLSRRLRRSNVGIVLERSDTGAELRAAKGANVVTIIGQPSELALYLTGRGDHAHLDYIGEDDAIAIVRNQQLGL